MRTKQALKNTVTSLLLQAVSALYGILVPQMFTALYGSAVNGLVSSITQFITYLSLVEAGIGAAGTVALYGPLARGETDEISGIVSGTKRFYLRSGTIFALLAAALTALYPVIVQNEIDDAAFIRAMVLVLSVRGLVDYFFLGKYRVLLMADQRGYVIYIAQIAGTVVMTVVSVLLMRLGASALVVEAVVPAAYLLRSAIVAVYVKRRYPQVSFRAAPRMEALGQRWGALLHQVVGMVSNNTDVVLLTLLLPSGALAEVSVYTIYNLVAYALSSLMSAVTNALAASFGQVMSRREKRVLYDSYGTYEFAFLALIFAVYSCMAALLHPFIALYSQPFTDGVDYVRWPLVALFTASGLIQSVRLPAITLILAAGHYNQTRWRAVAEAIINIVVSLCLIGPFGINGVLLGTCAAFLYRSTDVIVYSARHFVPGTLGRTARRLVRNLALLAVTAGAGLRLLPTEVDGWFPWLGCAVVYGVACCAVFALVNALCERDEVIRLIARIRGLLRRGNGG